ncbi:MAG: pstA [Solirubrobacterales bacterium]|nr:pstA [Solirubrobacterales bacterium]
MSSTSSASLLLAPVSGRRRTTDRLMRGILLAGTVIALIPLVLVVYYLFSRGLKGMTASGFFTTDPTGNFLGNPGGVKSAILGTLEIVALAAVIAIPVGIGVALYLVEFGKKTIFAQFVRYFIDVMTGVPSIVFGLFIYITLVTTKIGGSFTGWKGSLALALLMLPVVTRSAEVVLILVPESLREAALALGVPRWKVTMKIVLPTALPGLITGSLLAVARGMGETAPLLFTSATVFGTTYNLGDRMNSLPAQIFADISQPKDDIVNRAWASALTLVLLILAITLIARLAARRSRVS